MKRSTEYRTRVARRRERRFPVDLPVLVSSRAIPDMLWTARIADVSRRGLLLGFEQPATLEGAVQIRWNEREIAATVRHAEELNGEYRLGVELTLPSNRMHLEMLACENERLRAEAGGLREKNREQGELLAAAQYRTEVKSRFLASVSHELRTPLNGIMGFSEMLYDAKVGPVTADQKDCLSDILTCSRHLLTLVNQVLDLTRIESGRMDFEYELVELDALAREVIEGVKGLAARKRIDVRLEAADSPGTLLADAARLRQVLFNYLSNALKFTPEGGEVAVRIAREDAYFYRVEVEDNGVGIRPEDLSRLFTEFEQLGTAPRDGSGFGLGLAITRRLVEEQGGSVGVESRPNAGSRFWATLPSLAAARGALAGNGKG